ncbi:MAG: class I SAM-dependent methyltransferase [Terriglobia bacterium]
MGYPPAGEPLFWDAALYDSKHSFIWQRGSELLELLGPKPGEFILDLGCGTGRLTVQIAGAGAETLGIDSSPEMILEAIRLHPGLRFEVRDARDFSFNRPLDAVFSNAALHWVREPERVVRSIAKSLRAGGRFVAEFGGKGNISRVVEAFYLALGEMGFVAGRGINPWYYPSIAEYSAILERHGLETVFARLFDRPSPLEDGRAGLQNWLKLFAGAFYSRVPGDRQEEFTRRVETLLEPALFHDGTWVLDYRRLRIVAVKGGPSAE